MKKTIKITIINLAMASILLNIAHELQQEFTVANIILLFAILFVTLQGNSLLIQKSKI